MKVKGGVQCILMAMTLMVLSCQTTKQYPVGYRGDQIHFGQGGGFTGEVNYFVLFDDGKVFHKQGKDATFVFREQWKRNFTQQMFVNYHSLGLDEATHQHPGNLYYFIEFHTPDKPPHLISWGQQGYTPSEHIINFYQILYQSTRVKS